MSEAGAGFPVFGEADWRKTAEAALKGGALDSLISKTADGLRIEPICTPRSGARALRASAGAWMALARMENPDPGAANEAALDDLAQGADGLQVVFAGAAGAYGYGLAKWDAAALDKALAGVRFDLGARFELDLGVQSEAQAFGFADAVERSKTSAEACDVSFGLDPLGLRLRSGRASQPWAAEAASLAWQVKRLAARGFAGPFVAADGRPVHAAGGTPAQELAFALAAGVAYWRALEEVGFAPEAARAAVAFRLAADHDEFVCLAKFRAIRLLWARVAEAAGLPPRAARLHGESAWRALTARDPYVNVMRGALAAFSAGLGGADSFAILPFTRALGMPDAFARRLARNTQLIELRESHLGFVADPAAGSGAFEALTQGLCEAAWALFQDFERQGGLAAALMTGGFPKAVGEAAAALRRDVARLKAPITGVSAHPDLAAPPLETTPAVRPAFTFAGEPFAPPLEPMRLSEAFERLRDAADAAAERPKLFLAAMGPLAQHGRRVGFMRDLLEAGGIAAIEDSGTFDAAESARRFEASGARIACLCGADAAYAEHAGAFAGALRAAGAQNVWLAGRPGEHEAAWRAAGIDGFVFAGGDAVATLADALRRLGALA